MILPYNDTAILRANFTALLNEQGSEEMYQKFIEKNTALVPREFVQNHGIHLDLVFAKLSLAKDYATDFCYLSKSSADWNCVLIEIEKPQSRYFKGGSKPNQFHSDFQRALEQIYRWKAWFSNTSNLEGFVNGSTLSFLRGQGNGVWKNPWHVKYVLVHGRRSEFEGNEHRRSLIGSQETHDFHILTYDSLLEALHSKAHLYVASRKNEYIEILSNKFVSDALFATVDPTYILMFRLISCEVACRAARDHFSKQSTQAASRLAS